MFLPYRDLAGREKKPTFDISEGLTISLVVTLNRAQSLLLCAPVWIGMPAPACVETRGQPCMGGVSSNTSQVSL